MQCLLRVVAGALLGVALGCSDSAKMTAEAPTDTELAAYAASHQFPTTQPSDHLRVAAIISSDRKD